MKRFIAVLTLLLVLSASAVADNTEMLFRALCCMDKTGSLWDHAARASVISGAKLRETGGVYSGKIHLNKATYAMIVKQEEDGSIILAFDVLDTASRWSTDGVVARKFDKVMTELFLSPAVEKLWDPEDENYDKPVPRIQSGPLNLQKIGEKRKPFLIEWKNKKETIFARLTGQKTYRECTYRLTLQFLTGAGENPKPAESRSTEKDGTDQRPRTEASAASWMSPDEEELEESETDYEEEEQDDDAYEEDWVAEEDE